MMSGVMSPANGGSGPASAFGAKIKTKSMAAPLSKRPDCLFKRWVFCENVWKNLCPMIKICRQAYRSLDGAFPALRE